MERYLLSTSDFPPKRGGVARMLSTIVAYVSNMRPLVLSETASYRSMLQMFWDRRRIFDVLFVSHVLPIGTAAMMYRLFTGTSYDVLLHGMDFDLARSKKRKAVILWFVLRLARRVFANSKALANELESFSFRSCEVLYPCVANELIEAAGLIGERSGIGTRLLTVARLVERKGHEKVLKAMKELPDVTYTIVGDGPMKKLLEDAAERYGVKDRVTFLQHVPDGKLAELYASHDIFVMPTTRTKIDREGFGIVYLEAGVFGLPVVATKLPGVDEAVVDGETGILIEDTHEALVDALKRLTTDSELRSRLGRSGRERVLKNFTAEKTYASLSLDALSNSASKMPHISIVIPTYQHARPLRACIDSALRQTYPNIEIIVVDDGSTDNTQEVLRTFGKKITVLHQENKGGNAARNRGLTISKGEYVIFVDADIVMRPDMIDLMFATLQSNPKSSYAYSGFRFGWKRFHGVPFDGEKLRKINYIMTTSLVRKADFPGFDASLRRLQDWDVWLTMLEQGKTGVLVPGILFSVVIDGESRTGSSWLPSFVYSLHWPILGWIPKRVRKYYEARSVIANKHNLPL
ncbi:MAG: glycosyltransferase [Patescibacteria group bacterium]|jgi:phosphatidylinositol alpha-1,6-mannosyltransferase